MTLAHPRAWEARVMLGDIDITDEHYISIDTDTGQCTRYLTPVVRNDEGDLATEEVIIPGIRVVFPETSA